MEAADGRFALEDVPAGKWQVVVTAKGYQVGRAGGVVVEEATTTDGVEIRVPPGSILKGRVTDAKSGRGVPEATRRGRRRRRRPVVPGRRLLRRPRDRRRRPIRGRGARTRKGEGLRRARRLHGADRERRAEGRGEQRRGRPLARELPRRRRSLRDAAADAGGRGGARGGERAGARLRRRGVGRDGRLGALPLRPPLAGALHAPRERSRRRRRSPSRRSSSRANRRTTSPSSSPAARRFAAPSRAFPMRSARRSASTRAVPASTGRPRGRAPTGGSSWPARRPGRSRSVPPRGTSSPGRPVPRAGA